LRELSLARDVLDQRLAARRANVRCKDTNSQALEFSAIGRASRTEIRNNFSGEFRGEKLLESPEAG